MLNCWIFECLQIIRTNNRLRDLHILTFILEAVEAIGISAGLKLMTNICDRSLLLIKALL
jgi:hypothetical protein